VKVFFKEFLSFALEVMFELLQLGGWESRMGCKEKVDETQEVTRSRTISLLGVSKNEWKLSESDKVRDGKFFGFLTW
jgi:hypothetical protein